MTQAGGVATDAHTQIRQFIEENFLYMHPGLQLSDDDNLLEAGVLDSLGFVELVEEVQTRYGIQVSDVEITEENFGSIGALTRYVEAKQAS